MQTCFDIYAFSVTLQHPAPTQVVLQVVRRHAMEPLHPLFQPMVISVHMLDVIRTDYPFALTIAHHLMGYTLFIEIWSFLVYGGIEEVAYPAD